MDTYLWVDRGELRKQGYDDCCAKYGADNLIESWHLKGWDAKQAGKECKADELYADELFGMQPAEAEAKGVVISLRMKGSLQVVGLFNIVFECPPFCP